ncbi:MAG TPA: hypothetical protein VK209_10920 [Candidatus Sulfotelmatobacter sp.]|nr:hypothetical protein [Candidatus Sulfotelmatobacter sp.]
MFRRKTHFAEIVASSALTSFAARYNVSLVFIPEVTKDIGPYGSLDEARA